MVCSECRHTLSIAQPMARAPQLNQGEGRTWHDHIHTGSCPVLGSKYEKAPSEGDGSVGKPLAM